LAHELAHVKNHDTLLMTVTATIAGAISMLAQFGMYFGGGHRDRKWPGGMGAIGTLDDDRLAPLAPWLVQMAISRTREYAATIWAPASAETLSHLLRAGKDRRRCTPDRECSGRAESRNCASVHFNPLSGERMDNLFLVIEVGERQCSAETGCCIC